MEEAISYFLSIDLWGMFGVVIAAVGLSIAYTQMKRGQALADPRIAALNSAFQGYEKTRIRFIHNLEKLSELVEHGTQNSEEGNALQADVNSVGEDLKIEGQLLLDQFATFGNDGEDGVKAIMNNFSMISEQLDSRSIDTKAIKLSFEQVRAEALALSR